MHKCLSCNRPCSMSSVFCDTCRDALLERGAEVTKEEQELVSAGRREGGTGELHSCAPSNVVAVSLPETQEQEPFSRETEEERCWSRVAEESGRSLIPSGISMGERVDEAVDEMDRREEQQSNPVPATHVLAVPLPGRRPLPRRVRRALLLFCIVGALALLTDGVLLALSMLRHHHTSAVAAPHVPTTITRMSPQMVQTSTATTATGATGAGAHAGSLLLSTTRLVFTITQGQPAPAPQTVTFSGGSESTFSWQIVPEQTQPSWLHLSATRGSATTGVIPAVMVSVEPGQVNAGVYTSTLQVRAFDTQGTALVGSPAAFLVTLNVRPPCTLSIVPARLTFTSVLVSGPSPQTLTLTGGSTCTFPINWQISSDASWIIFSHASGTDSGAGTSITVQASSSGKLIGSYTAHITLTATDGSGAAVIVSPAVVIATLTVIG
jgi:hypothetical protein